MPKAVRSSFPFVLLAVIVVLLYWGVARSPTFQICVDPHTYENPQGGGERPEKIKESADSIDCVTQVADANHDLILAIGTILIAWFTGTLWFSAISQEKVSRTHERAYVIMGGLYGYPKDPQAMAESARLDPDARRHASEHREPWIMHVHNFGRTPGFIYHVKWGYCLQAEFKEKSANTKLSVLIERGALKTDSVDGYVVVSPTGNKNPWRYRYVHTTRPVNHVWYGIVYYRDVFNVRHFTTWAVIHRLDSDDTTGDSKMIDWT